MFPYIPLTNTDEKTMLQAIGVNTIEDLFTDIPEELLLNKRLNLPDPMSELEVTKQLKMLADKNKSLDDLVCFLGAGAYDHYIPSVVEHITSRSEFYTSYTPYQPEISQGTLQAIFEFQTMIANLTDMDLANASMYDGATACAEAAMMASESTKRKSVIISKTVHPETRKVVKTYGKNKGIEVIEIDYASGETDLEKLAAAVSDKTAAVIVQNPNFFGIVEDISDIEKIAHQKKSMLIMSVDPISLGILKTPGELGADIVVGDAQVLGNRLNFGGPYIGFMASTSKLMRKLPGRIVGETVDIDNKRAFVLTLQAREQHIRRQRATSNICSNQSLNALATAVYLSTLGKKGIKEVAEQCIRKAHYASRELTRSGRYSLTFNKPFFKEFVISSDKAPESINKNLLKKNILGGYVLHNSYTELKDNLLLCVTEKRTKSEIDMLVREMEG